MTITPGEKDFIARQGSYFSELLTLTDNTNTAIDLTGCSFKMQVRKFADSSAVIEEFSNDAENIQETDLVNGKITLYLTASQTASLTAGKYVYDLKIIPSTDTAYAIIYGYFTVDEEITQ